MYYNLNNFCNVIASLRKQKGWTQTALAERLEISSQSVSKWECGIGFPDVTLFPVIAELFSVSIGVLFGEEKTALNQKVNDKEYTAEFSGVKNIHCYLGNVCRIELIEDADDTGRITAVGDPVFLSYFDSELEGDTLTVNIKNPCGSNEVWKPYDRMGYTGENLVRIFVKNYSNYSVCNFLYLQVISDENENGNYETVCFPIS